MADSTETKRFVVMSSIEDRLKRVEENVHLACQRAGRDRSSVRIIVVTKTAPVSAIKEVVRLGYTDLGENRVQHLAQVSEEISEFLKNNRNIADINLPDSINWHMIGHLQRNKVKPTLKTANIIHSVDTLRLAEEINTAAAKMDIRPNIFLQVNCSEEPQKYGAPVGAAIHLADQFNTMPNLRLIGLMTMAPLTKDQNRVRAAFARARELFEEIQTERVAGPKFQHLSMGMSQDYEIAIEEGATMLRIGSAIFA